MRNFRAVALLLCAPTLLGWASVISGNSQMITLNSDPVGAQVTSGGQVIGVTPAVLNLKRETNKVLIVKKEGYKDQDIALNTKLNNTIWFGILSGLSGFLSTTTDAVSGAINEYSPNSYFVTLIPIDVSEMERERLQKKILTRNFILLNYDHLTSDIARGDGEYLSHLFATFGIAEGNRSEPLGYLKAILSRYQNVPAFAEAVIDRLAPG